MWPIRVLKKIRDIGVPAGMPPEEAKHVQFLNLCSLVVIVRLLVYSLWGLVGMLIRSTSPSHVMTYFALGLAFAGIMFITYLNYRRHHSAARIISCSLIFVSNISSCVIEGPEIGNHYWFLPYVGYVCLLFPRNERRLMLGFAVLNFLGYAGSNAIYQLGGPLVQYGPEEIIINRRWTINSIFITFVIAVGLSRWFTDRAEEHLQEEGRILEEANQKISLLGDKLKNYLPHQFVDALEKNPEAADESYRRRRLTIFFSDIQGFTRWTDKLEPEEVREVLNHYLSEMCAIARKWGGTVDKFIGDAMMIFFGDLEYTDDRDLAVRCVNMALEMQAQMARLREDWRKRAYDEALHIRIGINTGWATVGNFGSEDRLNYTALGSAVNLASRIETACTPDRVTISHTTYLLIQDALPCEPKGEITVKGFNDPIKIYEVLSATPDSAVVS